MLQFAKSIILLLPIGNTVTTKKVVAIDTLRHVSFTKFKHNHRFRFKDKQSLKECKINYCALSFFLQDYLSNIRDAMEYDGANVIGYSYWALLDTFEWTAGYT